MPETCRFLVIREPDFLSLSALRVERGSTPCLATAVDSVMRSASMKPLGRNRGDELGTSEHSVWGCLAARTVPERCRSSPRTKRSDTSVGDGASRRHRPGQTSCLSLLSAPRCR